MGDEKINELCKDCFHFKKFKEKCWFYWKDKKECTQKIEEGEEEKFVSPIEDRLNQ
ncbi:hypothetical protein KY345_02165 [Candidatus Woesearchaeota archaeon]|nr:hypothetical protein [Candidatus Woesearchaeota archaeon]